MTRPGYRVYERWRRRVLGWTATTSERRFAIVAYIVAPVVTIWCLALIAPASSRWALSDRIGASVGLTVLWVLVVSVRMMD